MNPFLYHIGSLHQKEECKIPGSGISGTKEKETWCPMETKAIMENVLAAFGGEETIEAIHTHLAH